jgi:hypothetical protein
MLHCLALSATFAWGTIPQGQGNSQDTAGIKYCAMVIVVCSTISFAAMGMVQINPQWFPKSDAGLLAIVGTRVLNSTIPRSFYPPRSIANRDCRNRVEIPGQDLRVVLLCWMFVIFVAYSDHVGILYWPVLSLMRNLGVNELEPAMWTSW